MACSVNWRPAVGADFSCPQEESAREAAGSRRPRLSPSCASSKPKAPRSSSSPGARHRSDDAIPVAEEVRRAGSEPCGRAATTAVGQCAANQGRRRADFGRRHVEEDRRNGRVSERARREQEDFELGPGASIRRSCRWCWSSGRHWATREGRGPTKFDRNRLAHPASSPSRIACGCRKRPVQPLSHALPPPGGAKRTGLLQKRAMQCAAALAHLGIRRALSTRVHPATAGQDTPRANLRCLYTPPSGRRGAKDRVGRPRLRVASRGRGAGRTRDRQGYQGVRPRWRVGPHRSLRPAPARHAASRQSATAAHADLVRPARIAAHSCTAIEPG